MAYTKTSLICLLLMIYMGYFYFSNFTKRHLPLRSTNYFNCYFFCLLLANIVLFYYLCRLNNYTPWISCNILTIKGFNVV